MARYLDLPPLGVARISRTARSTAESLIAAFYHQDRRADALLSGDAVAAERMAETAIDRMSAAFRAEFPALSPARAGRAGTAFCRALFLQDEIENWTALRARRDDLRDDALVSDSASPSVDDARDDPRWADVERLLEPVCAEAGIDPAYGERQTEFWRRHGQRDDGWMKAAVDAHRLKILAMVGDCDPRDADLLSQYFLSGVRLHDRWPRTDPDDDFDALCDLVAAYYQRVFDLRDEMHVG